jgi:hypothetical protein
MSKPATRLRRCLVEKRHHPRTPGRAAGCVTDSLTPCRYIEGVFLIHFFGSRARRLCAPADLSRAGRADLAATRCRGSPGVIGREGGGCGCCRAACRWLPACFWLAGLPSYGSRSSWSVCGFWLAGLPSYGSRSSWSVCGFWLAGLPSYGSRSSWSVCGFWLAGLWLLLMICLSLPGCLCLFFRGRASAPDHF